MSTDPPNAAGPGAPLRSRVHAVAAWLERRVELITAISLSAATLLTSWSGYEAALWDGRQSASYSEANSTRTMSTRYATRAGQLQSMDLLMFSQWLNAYAARDERLQAFYRARFRPEFVPAFDAWLASHPLHNPQAPVSPFATPQYHLAEQQKAHELDRLADAKFEAGLAANRTGDAYVKATVLLASAMFFGGICQVFDKPRARLYLAAFSILACLWGLAKVAGLPMLFSEPAIGQP